MRNEPTGGEEEDTTPFCWRDPTAGARSSRACGVGLSDNSASASIALRRMTVRCWVYGEWAENRVERDILT